MSTNSKLFRVVMLVLVLLIVVPHSAWAVRRRRVSRIAYSRSPVVAQYLRFDPFVVTPLSVLLGRARRLLDMRARADRGEISVAEVGEISVLDMQARADRGEISVADTGEPIVMGVRPPIRIPYRPPVRSPYRAPMPG